MLHKVKGRQYYIVCNYSGGGGGGAGGDLVVNVIYIYISSGCFYHKFSKEQLYLDLAQATKHEFGGSELV